MFFLFLILSLTTADFLDPAKKVQLKRNRENLEKTSQDSEKSEEPVNKVVTRDICNFQTFMEVGKDESRKWCRQITDDRTKEATLDIVRKFISNIETFGEIKEERGALLLRFDGAILSQLKDVSLKSELESKIGVDEILASIDNLFTTVLDDERHLIFQILETYGISLLHIQISLGSSILLGVFFFLRKYGLELIHNFGVGTLVKWGLALAWLINIPLAFIREYENETAKFKAAQATQIPEGCAGEEISWSTTLKTWFSMADIKDPCEKWQQNLIDPKYKISILTILVESGTELVMPALKVVMKNLRGGMDELLDGLGFAHQVMYLVIAGSFLILVFMWISGFKFKVSGPLVGLEFGPEAIQTNLSIEEVKKELFLMQSKLSTELKSLEKSKLLKIETVSHRQALPGPSGDSFPVSDSGIGSCSKKSSSESDTESFEQVDE